MYCTKCGKEIESGRFCADCAATSQPTNPQPQTPVYPQPQAPVYPQPQAPVYPQPQAPVYPQPQAPVYPQPQQKTYSQPSTPSYHSYMPEPGNRMYGFGKALTAAILGFVGFIWAYVAMVMSFAGGMVVVLLGVPFYVISIVFGIKSIKVFTSRKNTCAKPIPTLILGISGLSLGAIAAFFGLISFFITMSYM